MCFCRVCHLSIVKLQQFELLQAMHENSCVSGASQCCVAEGVCPSEDNVVLGIEPLLLTHRPFVQRHMNVKKKKKKRRANNHGDATSRLYKPPAYCGDHVHLASRKRRQEEMQVCVSPGRSSGFP